MRALIKVDEAVGIVRAFIKVGGASEALIEVGGASKSSLEVGGAVKNLHVVGIVTHVVGVVTQKQRANERDWWSKSGCGSVGRQICGPHGSGRS